MTRFTRPALVKALAAAGIEPVEIRGRGASLEVVLQNDKDARKFQRKVTAWGGFRTGWGGWHLRANYQSVATDFNDRSSRHHY